MITVFNRIYLYCQLKNKPLPGKFQKSEIGNLAMAAFNNSGITTPLSSVQADLKDFRGRVVSYPKEFTETLDNLVADYFENPPKKPEKQIVVKKVEPVLEKPKLRKRMPVRKPEFSSKVFTEK